MSESTLSRSLYDHIARTVIEMHPHYLQEPLFDFPAFLDGHYPVAAGMVENGQIPMGSASTPDEISASVVIHLSHEVANSIVSAFGAIHKMKSQQVQSWMSVHLKQGDIVADWSLYGLEKAEAIVEYDRAQLRRMSAGGELPEPHPPGTLKRWCEDNDIPYLEGPHGCGAKADPQNDNDKFLLKMRWGGR